MTTITFNYSLEPGKCDASESNFIMHGTTEEETIEDLGKPFIFL